MRKIIFFGLLAAILMCGFIGCMSPADTTYHSVIFHLDGGHIDGNPGSLVSSVRFGENMDSKLIYFPADPQKEKFIFGGWFTAKNGFGNEFTINTRVYAQLTVYAKWIPE
jgi:uncharacterized repeat protein (TIGR02543 family)